MSKTPFLSVFLLLYSVFPRLPEGGTEGQGRGAAEPQGAVQGASSLPLSFDALQQHLTEIRLKTEGVADGKKTEAWTDLGEVSREGSDAEDGAEELDGLVAAKPFSVPGIQSHMAAAEPIWTSHNDFAGRE